MTVGFALGTRAWSVVALIATGIALFVLLLVH